MDSVKADMMDGVIDGVVDGVMGSVKGAYPPYLWCMRAACVSGDILFLFETFVSRHRIPLVRDSSGVLLPSSPQKPLSRGTPDNLRDTFHIQEDIYPPKDRLSFLYSFH